MGSPQTYYTPTAVVLPSRRTTVRINFRTVCHLTQMLEDCRVEHCTSRVRCIGTCEVCICTDLMSASCLYPYGTLVRFAAQSAHAKGQNECVNGDQESVCPDDRSVRDQLRPIYLNSSVLTGAAGSAYYEAGKTKLFCSVRGPRAATGGTSSNALAADLNCEVRWAGFARAGTVSGISGAGAIAAADRERDAGFATDEERELGAAVGRALSAAVRLDQYPKSRIEVSLFVLEDGGGVAAAAVTAASLALSDAGVEVFDLTCGCTAAVVDGKIVLDPCVAEEVKATSSVVVSYMPTLARVTNVTQHGDIETEQLNEIVKLCSDGAARIAELVRNCLVKKAQKSLKKRKGRC